MKRLKNKTVFHKECITGTFTTIPYSILKDNRLSADSFRVLTSILSDADDYPVTHEIILNRFPMSENTLRKVWKNLEDCGYLKRKALPKGNYYTISEFGNLNGAITDSNIETVVVQPPTVTEELPQPIQEPIKTKEQRDEDLEAKNVKLYEEYSKTIKSLINNNENICNIFFEIRDKHLDVYPFDFYAFKNEFEKYTIKFKTNFYNEALEYAEVNNYHKNHKALKLFKESIKNEIYTKNNINFNYDTMWRQFQQQNRKQDVETIMADRLEQMHADGEGND